VFPTPFTVGWHTFSEAGADRNGNPVKSWTPALGVAGTTVAVMGWAPTHTDEPQQDHTLDLWDLLVPPEVASNPGDVVDLPGAGQFEVVGELQDFTKGPFGFTPGGVVKLRRYQ
jgi:hypothetical protein